MALRRDELEGNVFFETLQTKYVEKYKQAQKKNWVICIPCQRCLTGVYISCKLIDNHILKPSPFFKSHYVTTNEYENRNFEFEDGYIKTPVGDKIKILMEETGYNEDYKPFKIVVIERPLNSDSLKKNDFAKNKAGYLQVGTYFEASDCLKLLQSFPEPKKKLDKKINQFCTSYMVLPDYLHDAVLKLKSLIEWANEVFSQSSKQSSLCDENRQRAGSLEFYILSQVHSKVYPVIKKKMVDEDKDITRRLFSLYEAGLTPDQLGVNEPFCCHTPSAIVELASLNQKTTPIEKLSCMVTTLELLNQDIEKSLHETYSPINSNKDIPCLSSDDLIPLLVNVIVQARPMYLASNLYYVQNFSWYISMNDKFSFSLVTFQAAKEYIKSNSINMRKPTMNKIKKEMSLEELIQMTVEMQDNTKLGCSGKNSRVSHTTIDNQLENVTKMIEASTRELRQWPYVKDEKQRAFLGQEKNDCNSKDNFGDFMKSWQHERPHSGKKM